MFSLPSSALPFPCEFWCIKEMCHFSNANTCLRVVSEHGINPLDSKKHFLKIENVKNISQCRSNIFIPQLCTVPSCLVFYLSFFYGSKYFQVSSHLPSLLGTVTVQVA